MFHLQTTQTVQVACAMHAARIVKVLRAAGEPVALRELPATRTCQSCAHSAGR